MTSPEQSPATAARYSHVQRSRAGHSSMTPLMTTGRLASTYLLKKAAGGGSSMRPTFPFTSKGTSIEVSPGSRRTFHAILHSSNVAPIVPEAQGGRDEARADSIDLSQDRRAARGRAGGHGAGGGRHREPGDRGHGDWTVGGEALCAQRRRDRPAGHPRAHRRPPARARDHHGRNVR